jgi:hypothetical protein
LQATTRSASRVLGRHYRVLPQRRVDVIPCRFESSSPIVHLQTSVEVEGGFPANRDPKRLTRPNRSLIGPFFRLRGDPDSERIGPRDGAPEGGHTDIPKGDLQRWFPKEPSFPIYRTDTWLKGARRILPGSGFRTWNDTSLERFPSEEGAFPWPSRSRALQVVSVRGRWPPERGISIIPLSEDMGNFQDAIPFRRSEDRWKGALPSFSPARLLLETFRRRIPRDLLRFVE